MKYIINSVEAYSDGATPKVGVNTSAFSDAGVHLLTRLIVLPLDAIQAGFDLKQASASLLALVQKFASIHQEMNLDNLKRIEAELLAKEQARELAQKYADLINDAIVAEQPEQEIITKDYKVELLPIKVRPPVIEPIEEPITEEPIVKEVFTK